MSGVEIASNIHWIGVNDRTTDLFEGIWPISKEGITYNAYAISDKKNVIIDLAKAIKTDEFLKNIEEVFELSSIDYIILNHLEPDHTGVLEILRHLAKKAEILTSDKGVEMCKSLFGHVSNIRSVKDNETLKIGSHTLTFYMTPMLHWPETMMTFDNDTGTLFSGDSFGSYGVHAGKIFNDQVDNLDYFKEEALRYFVNVISKYSPMVIKTIDKIRNLSIKIEKMAPAHGLIWRKNADEILNLYKRWAEYNETGGEKGITLIYGSMYGNSEKYMNELALGMASTDAPVRIFDAAKIHASYILASLWQYRGVAVCAPTYEASLFPPVAHTIDFARRKQIKNKISGIFGSYLWSGGAKREFEKIVEGLNWDMADSFTFQGAPTNDDLKQASEIGKKFADKIITSFR